MTEQEVARYWDGNAEAWTTLSRMGYDTFRDLINTPTFMSMLPPVNGLHGLDIGCGEGHNTRLLAGQGAAMTAVDLSSQFLLHAVVKEREHPLGIRYQQASACSLPFRDQSFAFATSFMCLMDLPDQERALREAQRVLRPGGFFQFSITHPCFQTPKWKWILDEQGRRVAMTCGDYFAETQGKIDEWTFSRIPDDLKTTLPPFRIPSFFRMLSTWLNMLLDAGFRLERFAEPTASDEVLKERPEFYETRTIAYFLIIRCRRL